MTTIDITYHGDLDSALVPAAQVKPYPTNPKQGNVAAVAASIRTNGVYRPVYVQTSTGHIIAGHHVFYALTDELGQDQVPVSYLDVDDDRASRIRLADNKVAEGGYDDRLLAEELAALESLDGTGYDVGDLEALEKLLARELSERPASSDAAERVLEDTDEAGWPLIRCHVHPDVHKRWGLIEADKDTQRVGLLLDAAGF